MLPLYSVSEIVDTFTSGTAIFQEYKPGEIMMQYGIYVTTRLRRHAARRRRDKATSSNSPAPAGKSSNAVAIARRVARRWRTHAAALPESVRPQLTQLVDAPPEGDQWLHEIKYEGYRMHGRLDRGAVKLLNWIHKYPAIAKALRPLEARRAYLDGELAAWAPRASPPSASAARFGQHQCAALVFFLLHLDGEDFRPRPFVERQGRLAALLCNANSPRRSPPRARPRIL